VRLPVRGCGEVVIYPVYKPFFNIPARLPSMGTIRYTFLMTRESLVFSIGVIVFLTPFLGVPQGWKEYVFIACGVILMIIGFMLRRTAFFRSIEHEQGEHRSDAFSESVETVRKDVPDKKVSV